MQNNEPVRNANARQPIIRNGGKAAFNKLVPRALTAIISINLLIRAPKNIPIVPPVKPINPDSIKNRDNMSLFLAPTAFIVPISFVLSKTDVYIVFAIHIPPTTNEIAAIPAKNPVMIVRIVPNVFNN